MNKLKKTKAVGALAALAHETRIDAFRLLVRSNPHGLSVGEVGRKLGIPATTMSFHITQLTNAGLVVQKRAGKLVLVAVDFAAMNEVLGYLMENCCQENRGVSSQSGDCCPSKGKGVK